MLTPIQLDQLFAYNPNGTIAIIPQNTNPPTTPTKVRKLNDAQYMINHKSYSVHRIIYAMHNNLSLDALPRYILFKNSIRTDTRIENLVGTDIHPKTKEAKDRAVNNPKFHIRPDGRVVNHAQYKHEVALWKEHRAKLREMKAQALAELRAAIQAQNED